MRSSLARPHSVASLRPSSERGYRGLRSFHEYAETESQNRNQSAVNAQGELWEQETLQLRVTPPTINIDNDAAEDATKITLSSANRPGTLVEVVTRLVELSLEIKRACISSDRGWFVDDFYVTEKSGGKVIDIHKIAKIRKILCVEPSGSVTEHGGVMVLEMSGRDRPGLLADITQLLSNDGYDVSAAAVWTQGESVAFVMDIADMRHNKNVRLPEVCQKLRKELSGPYDCAVVSPTCCRGPMHHEHRLHFMLLREAKKWARLEHSHQTVAKPARSAAMAVEDISCKYRSPKLGKPNVSIQSDRKRGYWIVNIRCKDRSKLLFDTVCTLADLDFDVYHGSIDREKEMAVLALFVRPRFQHLESIHDRIEEVQHSLEDALTRRFPKGLKLHVRPSGQPGCLVDLLHEIKAANLCVTRARVRKTEHGNTVHTVYVMHSNGTPPDQSVVEEACRRAGGNLIFAGRESSCSNDADSLTENCPFFLSDERTFNVEWSGKSCSV